MISVRQIQRLTDIRAFPRLIERILVNGRCNSTEAHRRLLEPGAVAPAALGLALQRLEELTYGPCPTAETVLGSLLELQSSSGLFMSPGANPTGLPVCQTSPGQPGKQCPDGALAATAVALRGILDWIKQATDNPYIKSSCLDLLASAQEAADRGIAGLVSRLRRDDTSPFSATDLAITIWQLGDVEFARKRLGLPERTGLLSLDSASSDHDELTQHAFSSAA